METRILFSALTFDAPSLARLSSAQEALPLPKEVFRMIPERMFHLTLAYYGPTNTPQEEQILESLTDARRHPTPHLTAETVTLLPSTTAPRVVTLGVQGDTSLLQLAEIANADTQEKGDFVPHVTLARLRSSALEGHPLRLKPHILDLTTHTIEPFSLTAEAVTLFESVRKGGDTTYVPIETYPLA